MFRLSASLTLGLLLLFAAPPASGMRGVRPIIITSPAVVDAVACRAVGSPTHVCASLRLAWGVLYTFHLRNDWRGSKLVP